MTRIELKLIPGDPTYDRLSTLTGLTTPTDINNLVWRTCAHKLADHLDRFDPATTKAVVEANAKN